MTSVVSTGLPVDDHFRLSAPAGTIRTEGTTTQVGPDRSCNSMWSGPCPTKGTTGLMNIVEPSADNTPLPVSHLGMSRVDGCPECVMNVEPPLSSHPLPGGYRNIYVCGDCGFTWTTEWAV